ncbi:MAG TPA: GGDEF domain-containing protein [Kofleriaceae bacterium]|nr:GGDEF domain-containing protein [Kofleriaceae bacterium]
MVPSRAQADLLPLTLRFRDAALEAQFVRDDEHRLRVQARAAILVGLFVYIVYGALDLYLVPATLRSEVWLIRCLAMAPTFVTLYWTFRPSFARYGYGALAFVGLYAVTGLLLIMRILPMDSIGPFYPGLVLATFFTYNLIGTRFIYALGVDMVAIVGYLMIVATQQHMTAMQIVPHLFFIFSANLLGGAASYMSERQRRQLFFRELQLEDARQQSHSKAQHDRLTGLPNRDVLAEFLQAAIQRATVQAQTGAVLFIDLNEFKPINDRYGHQIGDAVLCTVAERLRGALRDQDIVCRYGGDEFVVIANDVKAIEGAHRVKARLLQALGAPLALAELPPNTAISASIGISLFPADCTAAQLLQRADEEMYRNKRSRNASG